LHTPYSAEFFAPHIGSAFTFSGADGTSHALTLEQVDAKADASGAPFTSFSLLFSSPREAFFEQGSYPLRHAQLGEHHIFISALSQTPTHYHYQAPFSVPNQG